MDSAAPSSPLHDLTAGLARGDDASWTQFHREYGPAIFRQLLGATRGDHDLTSEALQQAYLRIARHARPCDSAPMFSSWLRIVARSALNDCRRRRRTFWEMLRRRHDDPTGQADAEADDDAIFAALDAALNELCPEDRELLEAKYFARRDVRTIASTLVISEKAVESRLTRARAALRARLVARLARHEHP